MLGVIPGRIPTLLRTLVLYTFPSQLEFFSFKNHFPPRHGPFLVPDPKRKESLLFSSKLLCLPSWASPSNMVLLSNFPLLKRVRFLLLMGGGDYEDWRQVLLFNAPFCGAFFFSPPLCKLRHFLHGELSSGVLRRESFPFPCPPSTPHVTDSFLLSLNVSSPRHSPESVSPSGRSSL